jgi:hypothetical protein
MFQFPGFLLSRYCFTITGCPIRTSADQQSFALPRSFSQLTTSFVISESLGIHPAPLHTFLPSPYTSCKTSIFIGSILLTKSINHSRCDYLPYSIIQSVKELSGKINNEYSGFHIETILFSSLPIVAISRSRTGASLFPLEEPLMHLYFQTKRNSRFCFSILVPSR